MTHVRGGFTLELVAHQGFSLEGAIENPFVTPDDFQAGKRTFRERCSVCHGNEATGGLAPALNHSMLRHGDSDLAMYKVVRDGIPRLVWLPSHFQTKNDGR